MAKEIVMDNPIKVVIWDLDNTLWDGVLAEGAAIRFYENRVAMIDELNHRGIINAICSKNPMEWVKDILTQRGIIDYFVFIRASFSPKGEMIQRMLSDMNLRADNALFIDDEESNLAEAAYYNPSINVLHSSQCDRLLDEPQLKGKPDPELTRLKQYRQLEEKVSSHRMYADNDDFLRGSDIHIRFVAYTDEYFERLYELTERTNQLNFTKNRMSKNELRDLANHPDVETKLIRVRDRFGDYGIVGFYSLLNDALVHFVFSCRILNMGIEQFVYQHLGCPKLTVEGEVASSVSAEGAQNDFITLDTGTDEYPDDLESVSQIVMDETKMKVFAIGACDLFNPMGYFMMPNLHFVYECNVFMGNERGVNVGTEYLRSELEMNEIEKDYCRYHFNNYKRYNVFKSRLFEEDWDYVIMSFHDDMIYKNYWHRTDDNLRVTLSPAPVFGDTSVVNLGGQETGTQEQQREWLDIHFHEGEYISPDRFRDNVMTIVDRLPKKTKVILVNGPTMDYFRAKLPRCKEARQQIIRLNKVINSICAKNPKRFGLVDINQVIRSKADVSDYVFHLRPESSFKLFSSIITTMIAKSENDRAPFLEPKMRDRKLLVFGKDVVSLLTVSWHLELCGHEIAHYIHYDEVKGTIRDKPIEHCARYIDHPETYYIIIADQTNDTVIRKLLMNHGYTPLEDFVPYKLMPYKVEWNDG